MRRERRTIELTFTLLIASAALSPEVPGGEEKLSRTQDSAANAHMASSFIQLIQHDRELSKVAACPEWTDISASGGGQGAAASDERDACMKEAEYNGGEKSSAFGSSRRRTSIFFPFSR